MPVTEVTSALGSPSRRQASFEAISESFIFAPERCEREFRIFGGWESMGESRRWVDGWSSLWGGFG